MEWFDAIRNSHCLESIVDKVEQLPSKASLTLTPSAGSSSTMIAGALARRLGKPLLLVVGHRDEADEAHAELSALGIDAQIFPALESTVDGAEEREQFAQRIRVLRLLDSAAPPEVVIAQVTSLMQGVPAMADMSSVAMTITKGQTIARDALTKWLVHAGYERMATAESPGSFAIRGGITDIFPAGTITPLRLDSFGDQIERIFEVDLRTQATDREIQSADIVRAGDLFDHERVTSVAKRLSSSTILFLSEPSEIHEQARGYQDRLIDARGITPWKDAVKELHLHCARTIEAGVMVQSASSSSFVELPVKVLDAFPEALPAALDALSQLAQHGRVHILCSTPGELARAKELLAAQHGAQNINASELHLHRGFCWEGTQWIVPWHEVLNRFGARRSAPSPSAAADSKARDAFLFFEPGDFVVHRDHGIAKYHGLCQLPAEQTKAGSTDEEYLTLEFQGNSILHVPASKVSLVQRYVGAGSMRPTTSTLGGRRWKKQKEEVEDAVKDLAGEMMRVQAVRESTPGIAYPADSQWQLKFEAEFPFQETPDQLASITSTKRDMQKPRPMDRLICGDVGFGKTEVAIRAAFKAVDSGKQVAILVPTTVLAEQHERTFRERMRAYPIVVESVSRFKGEKEVREVLDQLAIGKVDVIIGTHRLLSADVRFHELGMVIIDEEQRFGVEHKQRLLGFRMTADVLTLSATPIPRTLHMAMLGLRDISSLTTPPPDRRAIVTEVMPWSPDRLGAAIRRELAREGQVFWVHNRVHDIDEAADAVRRLAPDARIAIGHGQMGEGELEQVMRTFMRREADILVSTTIIESGIDIPTANTMIIDDAHRFGLSELHQLRGRVGRSSHRAYCYLLLPTGKPVAADGMKRLRALEDYSMLGAGFRIAVRDLEIRGAGNLLGSEQSGHIAAVGYEMYCQMLDRTVRELRMEPQLTPIDTLIDIGLSGAISRAYIPSDRRRLEAYRRLADAIDVNALDRVVSDLRGAYGDLPHATVQLVDLTRLRLLATLMGIRSIMRRDADVIFHSPDPDAIHRMFRGDRGSVRTVGVVDPSGMIDVYWRPVAKQQTVGAISAELLKRMGRVVDAKASKAS